VGVSACEVRAYSPASTPASAATSASNTSTPTPLAPEKALAPDAGRRETAAFALKTIPPNAKWSDVDGGGTAEQSATAGSNACTFSVVVVGHCLTTDGTVMTGCTPGGCGSLVISFAE